MWCCSLKTLVPSSSFTLHLCLHITLLLSCLNQFTQKYLRQFSLWFIIELFLIQGCSSIKNNPSFCPIVTVILSTACGRASPAVRVCSTSTLSGGCSSCWTGVAGSQRELSHLTAQISEYVISPPLQFLFFPPLFLSSPSTRLQAGQFQSKEKHILNLYS